MSQIGEAEQLLILEGMNMKRSAQLFLVLSAVLLSACSNESDEQGEVRKDDHVWKAQTEALEKARNVDKLLQDAAEKQRKKIDEQSH